MEYKIEVILPVREALERIWFHITGEVYTLNYDIPRFHLVCQMNRLLRDIADLALLRVFDSSSFCAKFSSYKWEEGVTTAVCTHPLGEVTLVFQPTLEFDVAFEFSGDHAAAVEAVCETYYAGPPPAML